MIFGIPPLGKSNQQSIDNHWDVAEIAQIMSYVSIKAASKEAVHRAVTGIPTLPSKQNKR